MEWTKGRGPKFEAGSTVPGIPCKQCGHGYAVAANVAWDDVPEEMTFRIDCRHCGATTEYRKGDIQSLLVVRKQ